MAASRGGMGGHTMPLPAVPAVGVECTLGNEVG